MSIIVDGVAVPVVWSPSDLTGPDSDGHVGRSGKAILAIVHHRIVGSLETTVNSTFKPTYDDELDPGERRVSSHFGIGYWGTELRIVQFVALENTAYCNGQSAADRAACTWPLWVAAGRPPTNEITVSIEHEDDGSAGGYVVKEGTIRASIALDRLLLSGNAAAIRAAGIHCSDAAAAQLGKIKPSMQTLVDHRVVAPVSKPYCWRPYGADKVGFPQARYVKELSVAPQEDPMGLHLRQLVTADADPWDALGSARIKGTGHYVFRVRDKHGLPLPDGTDLGVVQRGVLDPPLEAQLGHSAAPGDRASVVVFNHDSGAGPEAHVALLVDVAYTALADPIRAQLDDVGRKLVTSEAARATLNSRVAAGVKALGGTPGPNV